MDHASFQSLNCETDPEWRRTALQVLAKGNKALLLNCDLSQTNSIQDACLAYDYVFMVLPVPGTAKVWLYLRPERRRMPRTRPLEADDVY